MPVTATRILDTRVNLGLVGPFTSPVARDLQVTGAIATTAGTQTVVPLTTGGVEAKVVILNVTVVGPTAAGFITVRPSDAAGLPTTSSLNFVAGQVVANSVTVQLGLAGADAGKIEIIFNAFEVGGPTAHVLVDIVGYFWQPIDT